MSRRVEDWTCSRLVHTNPWQPNEEATWQSAYVIPCGHKSMLVCQITVAEFRSWGVPRGAVCKSPMSHSMTPDAYQQEIRQRNGKWITQTKGWVHTQHTEVPCDCTEPNKVVKHPVKCPGASSGMEQHWLFEQMQPCFLCLLYTSA